MNIGLMIRSYRLQRGMSQGDIEKRTGLLRCYLSRVENGHTVPSLDTLGKIAQALDVPLAQFFSDGAINNVLETDHLNDDELRFLNQIRRYSTNLNDGDRKLLLAMVKKIRSHSREMMHWNLQKRAKRRSSRLGLFYFVKQGEAAC